MAPPVTAEVTHLFASSFRPLTDESYLCVYTGSVALSVQVIVIASMTETRTPTYPIETPLIVKYCIMTSTDHCNLSRSRVRNKQYKGVNHNR